MCRLRSARLSDWKRRDGSWRTGYESWTTPQTPPTCLGPSRLPQLPSLSRSPPLPPHSANFTRRAVRSPPSATTGWRAALRSWSGNWRSVTKKSKHCGKSVTTSRLRCFASARNVTPCGQHSDLVPSQTVRIRRSQCFRRGRTSHLLPLLPSSSVNCRDSNRFYMCWSCRGESESRGRAGNLCSLGNLIVAAQDAGN